MYDGILLGPGSLAKAITYPYSSTKLWTTNEYCTRDGRIYKFIATSLSEPEPWTPAHWQEVKLTDEMGSSGAGSVFSVIDGEVCITYTKEVEG